MNLTESTDKNTSEEMKQPEKAGLIDRFIAKTIDLLVVATVISIIPGTGFYIGLAYIMLSDGFWSGRSIGKKLIGLRVVCSSDSGLENPCGFKESIYRNISFAAGYLLYGILLGIPFVGWLLAGLVIFVIIVFEYLILLGSQNGMRLGDELAKTQVLKNAQGVINVS
ncbi:MAG: RDD family protein [Nitrospira sp.]|nr:RDD family protein [bacterium]MBL7049392.1 RDD family protein [Nitrospira sp.]